MSVRANAQVTGLVIDRDDENAPPRAVVECPFCGARHTHPVENARAIGDEDDVRAAPCDGGEYILTDPDGLTAPKPVDA
jgi:hypothetical protein